MKPFTAYWIIGTMLTSFGTVVSFVALQHYIPEEEPIWLVLIGLTCLGIGASVLNRGNKR